MKLRNWQSFLAGNWDLGFTAFGGPPVHFKIYHDRFVVKYKWIDELFFQELFSVSLALSGPASTKLLYCINLVHGGTPAAIVAFFLFTLPAATAMFMLSLGVANIDETLPGAAYAFLSGLNAAVVGVIALATTELSKKAITDDVTRLIVFGTASTGMLYNAIWYFPTLMALSGLTTLVYDLGLVHRLFRPLSSKRALSPDILPAPDTRQNTPELENGVVDAEAETPTCQTTPLIPDITTPLIYRPGPTPSQPRIPISPRTGLILIFSFLIFFLLVLTLPPLFFPTPSILLTLFTNLLISGTVIFGGGPVVIPLLRESIVTPGFVSPRDFLIGLAIIQSLPGPNFNIAVFLGSLTASNAGYHPLLGAVLAWVAIFLPGMVLVHGTLGVWGGLRGIRGVRAALRGVNAGAVGLIYTVVVRIWGVGLVEGGGDGRSLGDDPWWVVIAAANYVFGRWYRVSPPVTIIAGALMGLGRYYAVSA